MNRKEPLRDLCSRSDVWHQGSNYGNSYSAQLSACRPSHTFKARMSGVEGVCNYCQGAGLWRSRNKYKLFSPSLACSVVPRLKPVCADPDIDNSIEPFIAGARVFS